MSPVPADHATIMKLRSLTVGLRRRYLRQPGVGVKARDVIKRLEADGWYRIPSRGGHRQFKHPTKRGRVTVAGKLSKDVPAGTFKSIWRQAQMEEEV